MSRTLVSIPAAAEHLGVSIPTLRRYISQGHIRAYRMGKRLIRVDLNEIDASLKPIPTTDSAA